MIPNLEKILCQIEEKNKTEQQTDTSQSLLNSASSINKKRSDVAKRIIETYLSDPDAKPLNEKPTSTGLSADLISRLNFNPATKITITNEDYHQMNTSPKVIVSSTTSDDELRSKLNSKRKLDDEINSTESVKKTVKLKEDSKSGPALEYRGLLKNEPDTNASVETSKVVSLKPKRAQTASASLTLNERIRLSQQSNKASFTFENFKIETKNEQSNVAAASTVKKLPLGSLKSDSLQAKSAKKLDTQSAKVSTAAAKPKIIPITFDLKPTVSKQTSSGGNQSLKRSTSSKSIFDRINFS